MKRIILCLSALLLFLPSFSPTELPLAEFPLIDIEKKGISYYYSIDGATLNYEDMKVLIVNVPEADKYLKRSKVSNVFTNIFAGVGGFFVGYFFGMYLAGALPEWKLTLVGTSSLLVAIPISLSRNYNKFRAVATYNQAHVQTSYKPNYEINLELTQTRQGITVKF